MIRTIKSFEYFEAKTVEHAIDILSMYGKKAKVLAGGTDLLISMKERKINPQYAVYIKNVPELNYINYRREFGLEIGAATTLQSIASNPTVLEKFGALATACSKVGTPQIRNMGTIGGNLCQDTKCLYCGPILPKEETSCYRGGGNICYAVTGAKRCQAMAIAETASILICLDAEVSISTPIGQKTTPLEDFFISSGIVNLKEDEILTAIKVPNLPPNTAGIYLRHSLKGALGFALVGVAAVLTVINGVCEDARISLLGVARTPIRARKVEQLLKGEKIKDTPINQAAQAVLEEAHPLGDIFGSARYRREMLKVLSKQAINDVYQKLITLARI